MAQGALRFTGTADTPGSTDSRVDGIDIAGSADSAETRAVVCVALDTKNVPADLGAGDRALPLPRPLGAPAPPRRHSGWAGLAAAPARAARPAAARPE